MSSPDAPQTPPSDPATPATPAAPAPLWLRAVLGLAGLGLVAGFFMPWVHFGELVSVSGLALAVSSGQAVEGMSGPHGGLILIVPLAGVLLLAGAIRGHRGIAWAALVCGFLIFAVGLYTLVRLFLDSTGAGMWVVAACAVVATAAGILQTRRPTQQ